MLYQPTNVFPSLTSGLGNGAVDFRDGLNVSWQVNGNSALTSFIITIYLNDTASTQIYTTGMLEDGCPFYGLSPTGEVKFFSYTIPYSALQAAGMKVNTEYKLVITQYWSSGYVVQRSASAFVTRVAPSVYIANFPAIMPFSKYTFTANANMVKDQVNWVRWRVCSWDTANDIPGRILLDTGNLYGVADLQCSYDGFLNGNSYAVECTIETTYGMQSTDGWKVFSTSYSLQPVDGYIAATKICGHTGVLLSWDKLAYIPGVLSGGYSYSGGNLVLNDGTATWSQVNNGEMSFATPWWFAFQGRMQGTQNSTITIAGVSADVVLATGDGNFTASFGGSVVETRAIPSGAYIGAISVSPSELRYSVITPYGGLYPSETLYPGTSLYPKETEGFNVDLYTVSLRYAQQQITTVRMSGTIIADTLWIKQTAFTDADMDNIFNNADFNPAYGDDTIFAATFQTNSASAGSSIGAASGLSSYAIYRSDTKNPALTHIADVPMSQTSMVDFSVVSQETYTYFMYGTGPDRIELSPMVSTPVEVCFWDWTLLEAEKSSTYGDYHVVAEYKFGKNFSSGAIGNNNAPTLLENFTRYPLVQMKSTNYLSGSLASLIGVISGGEYTDTISLKNALYELSTTQNELFLKSRKGDLWRVKINGNISMETMDNTKVQAQSATIPWVQVGEVDASILLLPSDAAWNGMTGG